MNLITAALARIVSYRSRDSRRPPPAVYAVSLANGTVIANGFREDAGKTIAEVFVGQQFAGAGRRR